MPFADPFLIVSVIVALALLRIDGAPVTSDQFRHSLIGIGDEEDERSGGIMHG
jgi:hypothetical protein